MPPYQAAIIDAHSTKRGVPAGSKSSDNGGNLGIGGLLLTIVDGGMLLPAGLE